jgi:hypothetical protein
MLFKEQLGTLASMGKRKKLTKINKMSHVAFSTKVRKAMMWEQEFHTGFCRVACLTKLCKCIHNAIKSLTKKEKYSFLFF